MAKENVMKTIKNTKVNRNYQFEVSAINEVLNSSHERIEAMINAFVYGYVKGQRALKTEQKRKAAM
ncbi:hypothetical protein [Eubacterium aggregans]|uniref:hypothetical protein n=1 Tax=Eubacterium aggregans TaxID=81409 RepID=UPI003F35386C